MDLPPPPDGYRWTGRQTEIELIDPDTCPQGHPFRFGQRGFVFCAEHHGHTVWYCECGETIRRDSGAFVGGRPPCASSR